MPTTYTNGLKLPDLGSIDWYNSYKNNIDILDPIVGTVNGVATTYAPISHNHSASEITSGTIDIARLPPAALERMHIVADQTARYALTTSTVQEGDTVKQTDTGVMYLVVDSTKLNSADGYTEYSAGTASKAIADEDGTSIKSGYGKLAGANTWGNTQTVTGNDKGWNIINPDIEKGVIPSTNKSSYVWWADKNNNFLGRICSRVHTDGTTMLWLSSLNYYKNGALDPTGSSATTSLILGVDANAYKFVQTNADFRPDVNNAFNLGTSTNQWNKTYSKEYYYNGTQWGLDQSNNWTGSNIFTGSVILPTIGSINYKNYGIVTAYGYTQYNNYFSFFRTVGIYGTDNTPDTSKPSFLTFRPMRLQTELMDNIQVCNDGTNNYLAPITTGVTDLGTSTNQWKTLNGNNPGALSLISDSYVDLDRTDWTAGAANRVYINGDNPTYPGWLAICISNAASTDRVMIRLGTGPAATSFVGAMYDGNIYAVCPCSPNHVITVYFTGTITYCRYYACLGNV